MEPDDPAEDGHRVTPQLTSPGGGDDDWVHLEGEGTPIKESEDIVSWHHKVQSRLKEITTSPTDYHSVLHTIQQLQEIFSEMVERKADSEALQLKLTFSFDDLNRKLSIRQDSVFKVLVSLQKRELEDIERRLGNVEEKLEQEEGDYLRTHSQLLSHKELHKEIESYLSAFHTLLDHPQPARQGSFVQQQVRQIEQDTVGPKSQVFRESESVRNKATNQLIFCQDLERRLELRMKELEETLSKMREEYTHELSEVEHWLSGLYHKLCQEPIRDTEGGAYVEDGGRQLESGNGEPQDPGLGYDSTEELMFTDSGSSVGAEPVDMDTSVDADLEDDQYLEQVEQRVFSPVDPVLESEADLDPVLDTGSPAQEETDLDEVLSSRPGLTEQGSTDLDAVLGVEGVPVVEGAVGSDIDSSTVVGGESTGSGSTVQAGQRTSREQEEGPQQPSTQGGRGDSSDGVTGEEEGGSGGSQEEGSGSYEDESEGSEWSVGVELVPMTHDVTLHRHLPRTPTQHTPQTLTTLLETLQSAQEELSQQEVKVHDALTKVGMIVSVCANEEELKRRVERVECVWAEAGDRLAVRQAQLHFEKAQQTVRSGVLEARHELEDQPTVLLLMEVVSACKEHLLDYFERGEFTERMSEQLTDLQDTYDRLEGVWSEGVVCRSIMERLNQAYQSVTERVAQQKAFLEECLSQWATFQSRCDQLCDWLDHVEELVARETYGYDIKETEEYHTTIKALKEQLPSYESQFTQLFEQGSAMLEKMAANEEPYQYVDQQLSSFEQRWANLVTQESGAIDKLESAVRKVMIDWKAFNKMHHGTQSFITQMIKMVGTEPLETSNGDSTLLTTYMAYENQVSRMEVQYDRLITVGNELSSNEKIGNRAGIQSDLSRLQVLWHPLKDNISDSLKLLIREYNDWMMMKLQKMAGLVRQADELVKQKVHFVETFPLADLFERNASELLKEADALVAGQEQLDQLENDCTDIEEDLLQRQVQQETSSGMATSASTLELPATKQEKERLQENRLKLQTTSDALQPIINVFYLQLQLLQSIQDGRRMVSKGMEFVGEQGELEELLTDIDVKLSASFFEDLSSEAYDLGAVAEDCESTMEDIGEQEELKLPPFAEIAQVNRTLGDQVDHLSASTDKAKMRLRLFVQWWVEYRGNHDDLSPWLDGAEIRLDQLRARAESTQPPLVSPGELLLDVQEMHTECEEKRVLLNALSSTSNNIIEEMRAKGSPPGEITDQAMDIQQRFKTLCDSVKTCLGVWEKETGQFDSFLASLTSFSNWLNEVHSSFYDEVCIQIPSKATDDIIIRHKNKLEEYRQMVLCRTAEYNSLLEGREKWGDHLIPDETADNLPSPSEPSPPPFAAEDDFSSQVPLPYVKKRVNSANKKWTKVQELIVEREHQLEISGGSVQVFLESLQHLTGWIERKLKMALIAASPPASLNTLKEHVELLKALESEMEEQVPTIDSLTQSVAALKQTLSGPNAELLDKKMEEMEQMWNKLEAAKDEREKVCQALIPRIKTLWSECEGVEVWVGQRETALTECGPIGANLPRLKEQSEILKTLDEELLEKKKDPEELLANTTNLLTECLEGSGADISAKSQEIESRFTSLTQECAERQELCEEAMSAMQDFQKKVDEFVKWLEGIEKVLEEMKATKKPIGTVQLQLDEFYDFMRDVETHTEDFLVLCPEAQTLSGQYKPSDVLDELMVAVRTRWTEYVEGLTNRSGVLFEQIEKWNKYESDVKGLLDWISDEANKFSKKVTTAGDEGIEDHIESCRVFTETMSKKKEGICEIKKLADELRKVDGVKKNGTSDVDSRWNDVNQHWNSLCKLLDETMLHLASTFAEVRHIKRIRKEEFDWLKECELAAGDKVQTQGEIPVIEQEIETHKQLVAEVKGHQKECEFIEKTISYLVEHSRKENREPLKAEALDFCSRYGTLLTSEDTYVNNLTESIPYWEDFKMRSRELAEWIDWAKEELVSDRVASGNATVTKASLENAQNLLREICSRKQALNAVVGVGDDLRGLVVKEDQLYVSDTLECLREGCGEVEGRTDQLVSVLEDRLTSWQVFPVEEAQAVQEFLDVVSNAMEEDLEEELSSEQLMEKIEQLESLQESQQDNEDKVFTIEQSVGSEDIKKALEKNPDISKERNNLLQGWSCVSGTLKDKITAIKKKAKMVKELETLCRKCETGLKEYQSHLDTSLPPSVQLIVIHSDLRVHADQLHNQCQSTLTSLQTSFQEYDSSVNQSLIVPPHLKEKAVWCQDQFRQLSTRAEEWNENIEEVISSWSTFSDHLKTLSSWCRGAMSEVSSLRAVPNFAKDFDSLETRLQTLTEEHQEHTPKFDFLVQASPKHCTGDSQEVKSVRDQYTKLEKSWRTITNAMSEFPAMVGPWRELTGLYDKLCNSYQRVQDLVDRALAIVDERDGGHVSDIIHCLKEYQETLLQRAPEFQKLHQLEDTLLTGQICSKYPPARELKQDCSQVEDEVDQLKDRVKERLDNLEEQERDWRVMASDSMERLPRLEHQLAESRRSLRELEEEKTILCSQKEADQAEIRKKDEHIAELLGKMKISPPKRTYLRNPCKYFGRIILILLLIVVAIFVLKLGLGTEADGHRPL